MILWMKALGVSEDELRVSRIETKTERTLQKIL